MAKNYVNQEELIEELRLSREQDQLTNRAIKFFQEMIKREVSVLSYRNPMDREDVKSRAMLDILLYWRSFNPDHPRSNAFSYFTKIAFNAFRNRIKKEKKNREALLHYQDQTYNELIDLGYIPDDHQIHDHLENNNGTYDSF